LKRVAKDIYSAVTVSLRRCVGNQRPAHACFRFREVRLPKLVPEQGPVFGANLAHECAHVVLRRIADPEFGAVLRQDSPPLVRLRADRGLDGEPETIRTSDLQIGNALQFGSGSRIQIS
jgi:hypothetical protein